MMYLQRPVIRISIAVIASLFVSGQSGSDGGNHQVPSVLFETGARHPTSILTEYWPGVRSWASEWVNVVSVLEGPPLRDGVSLVVLTPSVGTGQEHATLLLTKDKLVPLFSTAMDIDENCDCEMITEKEFAWSDLTLGFLVDREEQCSVPADRNAQFIGVFASTMVFDNPRSALLSERSGESGLEAKTGVAPAYLVNPHYETVAFLGDAECILAFRTIWEGGMVSDWRVKLPIDGSNDVARLTVGLLGHRAWESWNASGTEGFDGLSGPVSVDDKDDK